MPDLACGPSALQLLRAFFAGLVRRERARTIDFLVEENRVLCQQLGRRRSRLCDHHRRRLAVNGMSTITKNPGIPIIARAFG